MGRGLSALGPSGQLKTWGARVLDPRSRVATGYGELDRLLYRGGFAPGELVILGGRTGTRKTTLMVNLIRNMLDAGTFVGLLGLDESTAQYVAKTASAVLDVSHEWLEDNWQTERAEELRQEYKRRTENLVMSVGSRPTTQDLSAWKMAAEEGKQASMQVVFLDYLTLLARDRYAGQDVNRIPRILEELQVWTNEQGVTTVVLHQVGRLDEGTGGRYHGDTPMTDAGLKYGGEEPADIILATYRPAKSRIGRLSEDSAFADMPDSWTHERKEQVYEEARLRVEKYKRSTFVQLLKNRPGTKLHEDGIRLRSPSDSMLMVPVDRPDEWDQEDSRVSIGSDMKRAD